MTNQNYYRTSGTTNCKKPTPKPQAPVCPSSCTQTIIYNQGPPGPPGPASILNFADFYALMPPDNIIHILPGSSIKFPNDGPSNGTVITRLTDSTFNLASVGIYEVTFQACINETGQLIIAINGFELDYTVFGRPSGTSQIGGIAFIQTLLPNSSLSLQNPIGNIAPIELTDFGGGARAVSAHLTIKQLI